MGGFGSGRRDQGGKSTTRDHLILDIRRWQREGLLIEGRVFSWFWSLNGGMTASIEIQVGKGQARLNYRRRNAALEWESESCLVLLTHTVCNFGGARVWFLCPSPGCRRRVAILYHGEGFACRLCQQLVYDSQREVAGDRAIRIAERIRKRLGWNSGILELQGSRPKGMHKYTFVKLQAKHDALVETVMEHARKKYGELL